MAKGEARRILEAALEIADETSWDGLRLADVARRLGLGLADVRRHYRDKEAIADAWLGLADAAMLAPRAGRFARLAPPQRIAMVIGDWLDALAPYRRVSGEMLGAKLYLGHPHHVAALVLRLSRTVQWVREAARLHAVGRRRQVEEIGLSALFVATVAFWIGDDSPGQARSRAFLSARLAAADRLLGWLRGAG